ncbi:MAG: DUF998 domain-containing protein [Tetrasphaera sp.]|nr:DUF998 domain-containing protein [Tetrasphaera sp.]
MTQPLRALALRAGVAGPVLYFGTQVLVGAVTPGYSFRGQPASDLGAGDGLAASFFNAGAILTGLAVIAGAVGLVSVSRRLPSHRVLTWPMAVAMISTGAAAVAAGVFPLPDSRHGGGPVGAGMFAVPLIASLVLWQWTSTGLRAYAIGNLVGFVASGAALSGSTPLDEVANAGALQRLLALTVFGAIGVICWVARRTADQGGRSRTARSSLHC